MVCAQCGAGIEGESRFCSRCGAPVVMRATGAGPAGAAPYGAYGARWRVRNTLRSLGVMWCLFAAYRVVAGLIGLIFFRAFVLKDGFGMGWPFGHGAGWSPEGSGMAWLVPVLVGATLVSAALAGFVGWSLLTRQSWGRVLAMVAACLSLIKFPFGTALGIYTLVVLTRRGAAEEYEAMANGA